MDSQQQQIVFMGKVGHGKTRLLNQLTHSDFPSSASASSCTRHVQRAKIHESNIYIIDTPGFYSSEDVSKHINAQFDAFNNGPISGVYVVVRLGDPSEIADVVNRMMDFTGEEDVRVICTFLDTVENEVGFDGDEVASKLSDLLEIPKSNVAMIGMTTDVMAIREFIRGSMHAPRMVKVSNDQRAVASSLSVGHRKFNKEINDLHLVLDKASIMVEAIDRMLRPGFVKDFAQRFMTAKAQESFREECQSIERRASELNPSEEHKVTGLLETVKKNCLAEFRCRHNLNDRPYNKNYCSRKRNFYGSLYGHTGSSHPHDEEQGKKRNWNDEATKELESDLLQCFEKWYARNVDATAQEKSDQNTESHSMQSSYRSTFNASPSTKSSFSGESSKDSNSCKDSVSKPKSVMENYEAFSCDKRNDAFCEQKSSGPSIANNAQNLGSLNDASCKQRKVTDTDTIPACVQNPDEQQGNLVDSIPVETSATTGSVCEQSTKLKLDPEGQSFNCPFEESPTISTKSYPDNSRLQPENDAKIERDDIESASKECHPAHSPSVGGELTQNLFSCDNGQSTLYDAPPCHTPWSAYNQCCGAINDVEMEDAMCESKREI